MHSVVLERLPVSRRFPLWPWIFHARRIWPANLGSCLIRRRRGGTALFGSTGAPAPLPQ